VQPQTRILMRVLRRLRIPTLIFVNKIDRVGAGDDVEGYAQRLDATLVRTATFHNGVILPASGLEALAERDDELLAAFVDGRPVSPRRLRAALRAQTRGCEAHPVFFSAITGAGVGDLLRGIAELLPIDGGDPHAGARGAVFKVERDQAGRRLAYVRMFERKEYLLHIQRRR
jgi:ribosomal protection tetracycline resistance protein